MLGSPNLAPYKNGDVKRSAAIDSVTHNVAKKLSLDFHLNLVGTGRQAWDGIEMLGMKLDYANEVDLNKARALLVTSIQTYLDEINHSKEIRRYIKKYPFTASNLEIGIYVHEPDGSDVPKDKLFYLSAVDGVLYYYLDNVKGYPRIVLHQETYDDALKMLTDIENKHIAPSSPSPTANQKF